MEKGTEWVGEVTTHLSHPLAAPAQAVTPPMALLWPCPHASCSGTHVCTPPLPQLWASPWDCWCAVQQEQRHLLVGSWQTVLLLWPECVKEDVECKSPSLRPLTGQGVQMAGLQAGLGRGGSQSCLNQQLPLCSTGPARPCDPHAVPSPQHLCRAVPATLVTSLQVQMRPREAGTSFQVHSSCPGLLGFKHVRWSPEPGARSGFSCRRQWAFSLMGLWFSCQARGHDCPSVFLWPVAWSVVCSRAGAWGCSHRSAIGGAPG